MRRLRRDRRAGAVRGHLRAAGACGAPARPPSGCGSAAGCGARRRGRVARRGGGRRRGAAGGGGRRRAGVAGVAGCGGGGLAASRGSADGGRGRRGGAGPAAGSRRRGGAGGGVGRGGGGVVVGRRRSSSRARPASAGAATARRARAAGSVAPAPTRLLLERAGDETRRRTTRPRSACGSRAACCRGPVPSCRSESLPRGGRSPGWAIGPAIGAGWRRLDPAGVAPNVRPFGVDAEQPDGRAARVSGCHPRPGGRSDRRLTAPRLTLDLRVRSGPGPVPEHGRPVQGPCGRRASRRRTAAVATRGLSIAAKRSMRRCQASRLEHAVEEPCRGRARRVQRREADMDVVGVIGERERVRRPAYVMRLMIWCGLHGALEREEPADRRVGDRAGALIAEDRGAVDRRDVDGVAAPVLGHVAGRRHPAVAALQRADRGAQARTSRASAASRARGGRRARRAMSSRPHG